tara:strand:- start:2435 stop:3151 length:717 start_codon:yes stop_codon:yes gene_type:complete
MSNLVPYQDIEKMAKSVAASGLFGIKTRDEAIALMLVAQAEGAHPAQAARDYHVIQGRPALKADSMLARFQAAGGAVKWTSYTDNKVAGIFSHPQGGELEIEWTMDRAKAAGLTGKQTWKQYPRQMLRARVISEGIRTVYPGVAVGVYTEEEVRDFDAAPVKAEVVKKPTLEERIAQVSADDLMARIDDARNEVDLKAIIDDAKTLPDADKARVRDAYKIKRDELADVVEGELIQETN